MVTAPSRILGRLFALALACTALAAPAALAAPPPPPGQVFTWGANSFGRLGFDPGSESFAPFAVPSLTNAFAVAGGGDHSLAVMAGGGVKAWGKDLDGQLGNGPTNNATNPTPVTPTGIGGGGRFGCITVGPGGTTNCAEAVSAGFVHSVALMIDGTIRAWGADTRGELGNNSTFQGASAPVNVSGISTATAISSGHGHNLALLADGSIRSWGYNGCGALGVGSKTNAPTPVTVSGILSATAIVAGGCHSLAVLANGKVMAWGDNTAGELGDLSTSERTAPVEVKNLPAGKAAVAVAAGSGHSLALFSDGTVWAWGSNGLGQLGIGNTGGFSTSPLPVPGLTGVAAIGSGATTSYAIKSDGTLWSWGDNGEGQLGTGNTAITSSSTPVQVAALGNGVPAIGNNSGGSFNGQFGHTVAIARPIATATPASLAFAARPAGTTSPPQTVTVQNTGVGTVTVASSALAGPNAGNFAKSSDGCTGQTLAAGASCPIQVVFKAGSAGIRNATLEIGHNAIGGTETVALTGGGPTGGTDIDSPAVEAASMTRRFAVARRGAIETPVAAGRRRAPRGTTFKYTVSEASRVVFSIHRKRPGRRVRGKCRKPTGANRKRKRCTRHVLFGRFAQEALAGANTKRWSGRLGRKRLRPGRYRATLIATDGAGNKSAPKRLRFTVVRR